MQTIRKNKRQGKNHIVDDDNDDDDDDDNDDDDIDEDDDADDDYDYDNDDIVDIIYFRRLLICPTWYFVAKKSV